MLSAPPVKKLGRLYVRLFVGCEEGGGAYDGRTDRSCGEFFIVKSQRGISAAPVVASGYVKGLSQTSDV